LEKLYKNIPTLLCINCQHCNGDKLGSLPSQNVSAMELETEYFSSHLPLHVMTRAGDVIIFIIKRESFLTAQIDGNQFAVYCMVLNAIIVDILVKCIHR